MASEEQAREPLTRATNAKSKPTKVKLNELKFDTERYCHRQDKALSVDNLKPLMDQLILEGLQTPVEYFLDAKGIKTLVKGHRRVKACRELANRNEPGFTLDMEIQAIEVDGASPVDLLIRSISDNEVHMPLDRNDRIRVAKKLYDAGVPIERAAVAMGVSPTTYDRDLIIARHAWMFQHVVDGSVGPTDASALLEEAVKAGRMAQMREDIDAWVAAKKQTLREKEKLQKARSGKDLSEGEKQVKKFLSKLLVDHWKGLIRAGKRFDEDTQWVFDAGIEPDKDRLRIGGVTLDLAKDPLERLAQVGAKLSRVVKQLVPYIEKAKERETAGSGDSAEIPFDLDYLRGLGLDQYADALAAQTQAESEPAGEEAPPEQPAKREEQDLTADISLPTPETAAPTPTPVETPEPASPTPPKTADEKEEPKA